MPSSLSMTKTFGKQPSTMPKGFFKEVEFPVLAKLDEMTGDHRLLNGDGADSRVLPLSIKYATKTSAMGGHDGAEISGTLFEVTIDPANGKVSGRGFLLDDENGRRHARLIHLGAMKGNSVDLAEVKARYVESLENDDYWIEFYEYKLAATTGVSTPAFADAHAVVEPLSDDELIASLGSGPLVAQEPEVFWVNIIGAPEEEIVASGTLIAEFSEFYVPEADRPTKIVVDGNGLVHGHLALWESCHDGYSDRCMRVPRPTDAYASFNKAGVLTDRGQVETGPIFAFGGHRPSKSAATIEQAYGGIENAWCDVRVTEGQFGPWISGRVRPGVSDETVYAARASRISGHWVGGRLKAIVSVNAEGFDVPGSGAEADLVAGFAFATNDEEVVELVASFPACEETEPVNQITFQFVGQPDLVRIASSLTDLATTGSWTVAHSPFFTRSIVNTETVEVVEDELRVWADEKLADILGDDRDEEH